MAQVYLRESASVLCFYSSKPLFICKHSSVSQTKSNFCNIPGLPSPCGIWSTLHKLQALQSKNTTPLLIVANFLSTVISFKNISLNRKTSILRKLVSTILLIRLPFLFFLPLNNGVSARYSMRYYKIIVWKIYTIFPLLKWISNIKNKI